MDDNRPFPIQQGSQWKKGKDHRPVEYYKPSTIPWWLAEEAYEYYVEYAGDSQSLEKLAERGGFGREEILCLLRKKF